MATVDPSKYSTLRALDASIEVPLDHEIDGARHGIASLFSLMYSCPTFSSLDHRDVRCFVRKWIAKSISTINEEGFTSSVKLWSKLGSVFLNCFTWKNKDLTYEISPELSQSPIFTAIVRLQRLSFHSDRDLYVSLVKWIYNWHIFLAKIPLERKDLLVPAVIAWVQRQEDVKNFGQIEVKYAEPLRLITTWLYDLEVLPFELKGKHGPGATNDGAKTIPEKESTFVSTMQSIQILGENPSLVSTRVLSKPRKSKLKMVKKDIGNLRPITMESVPLQHAQQSLKRILYRDIDEGYAMAGNFIKFSDQKLSQKLALSGSRAHGSKGLKPDTIDLSAASDLLSVDLVCFLFSGDLLSKLLLARTWDVQIHKGPEGTCEIGMYAGMGSATCFPVQTIVFTAMAILATVVFLFERDYGFIPEDLCDTVREYLCQDIKRSAAYQHLKRIRVYGDDIIVPNDSTENLMFLLDLFGLRVNKDKSFIGDKAVREACGIFAFAGYDITPTRYRVLPYKEFADFAVYDSLRSLVNQAFCSGYLVLYRMLIRSYRELKPFKSSSDQKRGNIWRVQRNLDEPKKTRRIEMLRLEKDADILFEEFRGDNADYIGVISTRPPVNVQRQRVFNEIRSTKTAYSAKLKTENDGHEQYHFDESLFKAFFNDVIVPAHGKLPRDIRLERRVAYQRYYAGRLGWAWVPDCSG